MRLLSIWVFIFCTGVGSWVLAAGNDSNACDNGIFKIAQQKCETATAGGKTFPGFLPVDNSDCLTYAHRISCANASSITTSPDQQKCTDADKDFNTAYQKLKKTCGTVGASNCVDMGFACTECRVPKSSPEPDHCNTDNVKYDDKEEARVKKAYYDAKRSGLSIPKPRSTAGLYACPAYASSEAQQVNKRIDKSEEVIKDLEKEIRDLVEERSTAESDIANANEEFASGTQDAKKEYDDAVEEAKKTKEAKTIELETNIQNNFTKLEALKIALIENSQKRVSLVTAARRKCFGYAQKCISEKTTTRNLLYSQNKLSVSGGLRGLLGGTGTTKIGNSCGTIYPFCRGASSSLSGLTLEEQTNAKMYRAEFEDTIDDIENGFNGVDAKLKIEIDSAKSTANSLITQLTKLDPEAADKAEKARLLYKEKFDKWQSTTMTKLKTLNDKKARLDDEIKKLQLDLAEKRAKNSSDVAYAKAAERSAGGIINEDANKDFQEFSAAFGEAQAEAGRVWSSCCVDNPGYSSCNKAGELLSDAEKPEKPKTPAPTQTEPAPPKSTATPAPAKPQQR